MKNRHEQFLFKLAKMIDTEIESVQEYRYLCDQGQGRGEDEHTHEYMCKLNDLLEYIDMNLFELNGDGK